MQLSKPKLGSPLHRFSNSAQFLQQALKDLSQGCFIIRSGTVEWFVYVYQGCIAYLTHSIEPLDRLNSHLIALSRRNTSITPEIRAQLRVQVNHRTFSSETQTVDHEGLQILLQTAVLDLETVQLLGMRLSIEALEALLLVQEGSYSFYPGETVLPGIQPFNLETLMQTSQQNLKAWQAFGSLLWSPYQRPYLSKEAVHSFGDRVIDGMDKPLGRLLNGFSFRHLALFWDQEEVEFAKTLYPFILEGTIALDDPQPSYDELPRYQWRTMSSSRSAFLDGMLESALDHSEDHTLDLLTSQPHIVCVHSNSSMLDALQQALEEDFQLSFFSSSIQALIEIPKLRPDLILLSLSMPHLESCELCRLLRHHPDLAQTPIFMLYAQSGLVEQSKAKLSGATAVVTELLNPTELLKLIFHHLD